MSVVKKFVNLVNGKPIHYNEKLKAEFKRLGTSVLKSLADLLGLEPGSYDLRWEPGGPAVSGDVTLHGEEIYIQFSQSAIQGQFMYRRCAGRKDYRGEENHWFCYATLAEGLQTSANIIANNMGLTIANNICLTTQQKQSLQKQSAGT